MRKAGRLFSIVLLMSCCIYANAATADLFQAARDGAKLNPDRVIQLEGSLLSNPVDSQTRARLLGYYSLRKTADPRRRALNVRWFVQNMPANTFTGSAYCQLDSQTDQEGYGLVKAAWIKQRAKDPNNTALLEHAANFFLASDDAIAEEIFQHCIDLEPNEPKWLERLAELYERRALKSPTGQAKSAAQALAERDKLFLLIPDVRRRFDSFVEMPRDAFLSGDPSRAKQLAAQLLAMADNFHDDPSYGIAIHDANIVLGRVALNLGEIENADKYLIAAGNAPASAKLASDGPDMGLAKELLARGERKTVREYLDLCGRVWSNGSARLKAWQATIDDGGTPDFGDQASW